jgi:hypothetical protein
LPGHDGGRALREKCVLINSRVLSVDPSLTMMTFLYLYDSVSMFLIVLTIFLLSLYAGTIKVIGGAEFDPKILKISSAGTSLNRKRIAVHPTIV